ncbi:MAG: hypothetical protein WD557_19495 [Dehalococcoidia bacterium]
MKVQFAFLADFAESTLGNKVSALGLGIDRISVQRFPAVHGIITFVCKVEIETSDNAESLLVITFGPRGSDSRERVFAEPVPVVPRTSADQLLGYHSHTVTLQMIGLRLPAPGLFTFELEADGQHLLALPLAVVEREPVSPPLAADNPVVSVSGREKSRPAPRGRGPKR